MDIVTSDKNYKTGLVENFTKSTCICFFYITCAFTIFVLLAEFTFKFGFLPKNVIF